jgi:hypothetical protein
MDFGKWFNGITLSRKVSNGFDDLQNANIHDDMGSLLNQKDLENKSGTLITAGCYQAVAPNGDTYFFSKSDGKIWKRAIADGTYTLVRTGVNGAYKGATYYRNYIYYTMDGFLGRYAFGDVSLGTATMTIAAPCVVTKALHGLYLGEQVNFTTTGALPTGLVAGTTYYTVPIDDNTFSLATTYANAIAGTKITTTGTQSGVHTLYRVSWNDNFNVLTSGYPHPLFQFDLILYIGNQYNIASVDDAGVFSSSVLDLPIEFYVTALINLGDDLLILANSGNYINDSAIFRWNSYSNSWTVKDSIKETDVYAFLDADDYIYAIAKSGSVYLYTGSQLEMFSQIRNPKTTTGHQLTTNFQGKPLVANGGKIYSLYRKNRNLPISLCQEFTCSVGEDATIHSIIANGSNLYVSWELSGAFGIDEISANYAPTTIITPRFKKASNVKVFYDDLNGGTVQIYSQLDGETAWTEHTTIDDSEDERCIKTVDSMIVKAGAQVKIIITPSVTTPTVSPILDYIQVT